MDFIEYLDRAHSKTKQDNNIKEQDAKFISYYELLPPSVDGLDSNFEIKKDIKTKLSLLSDDMRVYLSDSQIIDLILKKLDEPLITSFLSQLIVIYKKPQENQQCFTFRIDNQIFNGFGLSFLKTDNKSFQLHSDNFITTNELIFIINFIISKDYYAGIKAKQNFLHLTLCKYIVLLSHIKFDDRNSLNFLTTILYPSPEKKEIISSKKLKEIFSIENIKKFDINLYS